MDALEPGEKVCEADVVGVRGEADFVVEICSGCGGREDLEGVGVEG